MSMHFRPGNRDNHRGHAVAAILGAGFGAIATLASTSLWHGNDRVQLQASAAPHTVAPAALASQVARPRRPVALPTADAVDPSDLETTQRSIANYDH